MMKKNHRRILFALILLLMMSVAVRTGGFNLKATPLSREFGITQENYVTLHEQDSHGGFHGDGLYFVVIDCANNPGEIQTLTADWLPMPMPESLLHAFGSYAGLNAVENGLFELNENCRYYFHNRHSEAAHSGDTDIFKPHSVNFSLAIFNPGNNTFCLMCYDS